MPPLGSDLTLFTLLGVAIGLAMDAFAVALATGLMLDEVTGRHKFRIAFHFGLFQFLMPVLGWCAGKGLVDYIRDYDHWVAFGLLTLVGLSMLREAWHGEKRSDRLDPTRGWMLVTLSVATSIDAFAVGLSMALLRVPIWAPAVVIGAVAALLSLVGITFGRRLGPRAGRWAAAAGGCLLIFIGARILVSHLAAV